MALKQTKPAKNKRNNPNWKWEQFVKHFLEQTSDSIPRNTKMRLMTILKSINLESIPSWLKYTNTKTEFSHFLNNFNIDCESDQSKVDNFDSLRCLIFDNIVQAQLFSDRILKDEKLGKKILKKINSITGDQITLDEDPNNFSEGIQKLVANIVYPWLDKSPPEEDEENYPQISSEINDISEDKELSKISSKPKTSWLEKFSTNDYNITTDNTLNNDSKILSEIESNTSQEKSLIDNEKNKKKLGEKKPKEKKSKKKKTDKKKSNKRHTRYVSKKKKKPFNKNLQSKSDSLLLETPIINNVNQDISEEKQGSKLSFEPKHSGLDKPVSNFHDNSSQAHTEKNKNKLNDLNENNVPLSKTILPELKFDTTKEGKLKPSNLQDKPAKKNLTINEYDEDNDNKKNGVISDINNRNIHLDTSRSIYNSKINDINKTDGKPINGMSKKVIYSGKIMNKLIKKFKSKSQNIEKNKTPSPKSKLVSSSDNDSSYGINPTTVKIKKIKESSSISRKGKLVSKIKVKPEKFKRSTPIPGKEKLDKKSNVVSNKTVKKKPSVKKTKKIVKLPIISKKKYYFDDDTVREIKRPADEILLKSISHTIFENNNEFNTKPMQQSYSTNKNKNDYLKNNANKNEDSGKNYMEDKTNINKNISFYDKENNKKLSGASNDNDTRSIDQNFRGDKFIVNKNIPVEYQKLDKLTNTVQDNKNVDIEPNSMDGKSNANEDKTVYDKDNNKLANNAQDTNVTNIEQNSMDEKKNVVENKTVYDKDYNSLTNNNTDQINEIKNIVPNFIDENKKVNDKISSFDNDYNKITNKAQDKDKINLEQPMDEKNNVNEYSTFQDKDYNILTNTDQYNDKKNIIPSFIDENQNFNEKITSFDKEYNNLTSKAQDKYENNSKQIPMDEKMNVNEYRTVHDKDSNKFTDTAENKNKTDKEQKLVDKKTKTIDEKNIIQSFIDENTNVNEKITNYDKEYNELINIAQDKEKKNIEQKPIDDKNNVHEYNTVHDNDYNKLTNIAQDNNTPDKEQKLRNEKTNIHEYKTDYDKDYNTLTNTDHYNNKKNITPNFIDENMNINEKNTNFNNDFNQITNNAQHKNKNIEGQKPMDEKTNVNEYSTDRVKDYNTLTNTIRFNDENIRNNYLDENMNVNEKITNFDKDYNKLTNKFQDKDKNNIEKKPMDQKTNVYGHKTVYDKDYDTLTNIDRYNDKINIRTNYLDENMNVNEKINNFDKDYNKLTNKFHDEDKNNIENKSIDQKTNVNGYRSVYDKDTLTNIDRYNDKINIRTNYLDENTNVNEKKTIRDKCINKLTNNSQGKNKKNIDENTYTNENINIYDKDCSKYRYNSMSTDDHGTQPLKSLSPIRVVDRKIVNNRKTAECKTDNTKITQLDSNSNKLSKTSKNRKIKCNEVRKNVRCNNVNNEKLDKIEEKFKSRIMDDKMFWEKWIKRASMDCIKSFNITRPKEGSKYRYATNETKMKTMAEYEEVRKNPGIIYQIRKKDSSDFSLCKTVLPLYEIRDSTVDKYSDYCNDIRLSKLCGNIHPIITGPPIENDSKLSERLEDLDSWEHNFDKCICQNKLTKMCSDDDKLFEPKYPSCKNQKKMF